MEIARKHSCPCPQSRRFWLWMRLRCGLESCLHIYASCEYSLEWMELVRLMVPFSAFVVSLSFLLGFNKASRTAMLDFLRRLDKPFSGGDVGMPRRQATRRTKLSTCLTSVTKSYEYLFSSPPPIDQGNDSEVLESKMCFHLCLAKREKIVQKTKGPGLEYSQQTCCRDELVWSILSRLSRILTS